MNQVLRLQGSAEMCDFAQVESWIFDLDNTLYPHDANLWEQVDNRITTWIAHHFGVDGLTARAIQKHYYQRYGTSLRGLMIDEGIAPEAFLEFAHDIDHSGLAPNPVMGTALAALPGRKLIFTSGSRKHAHNIIAKLGIAEHFEDVFDIVAADFLPKPARETYERFLSRHGVDPRRAAMFEDLSRNLEVPEALGMRTVLVVPRVATAVVREAWELAGLGDRHIHHMTDDLAVFLTAIARSRGTLQAQGAE
jgi:putative hydrolase of the HAD superfamily